MFEKTPSSIKMASMVGVLAAGPATAFGFIFGGAYWGAGVLVFLFFYFIILYMIAFRSSL